VTRAELAAVMRDSASCDREILAEIKDLSEKVSKGFSNAHNRIDPIAELAASTAKLLDHHLHQSANPTHPNTR